MSHIIGNGNYFIRNVFYLYLCFSLHLKQYWWFRSIFIIISAGDKFNSHFIWFESIFYQMNKCYLFSFIAFVRNEISESGMSSLSSALEVNSTVTSVRLEECIYIKLNLLYFLKWICVDNRIGGYPGPVSLLWLFEGLPHLTSLDLNVWVFNKGSFYSFFMILWKGIGDSGACSIGDVLKVNSTLTKLYLWIEELMIQMIQLDDIYTNWLIIMREMITK